jgi:hypothetical protein
MQSAKEQAGSQRMAWSGGDDAARILCAVAARPHLKSAT